MRVLIFLMKKMQVIENKNTNKIMSAATIAIALAAMINAIVSFNTFEIKTPQGLIALVMMAILLIIVSYLAMQSFGRFLKIQ